LAPAPTVRSISPRSGTTQGGTTVAITGANFTGATAVTLGGTRAAGVTVVSASTITAVTPAHAPGVVNVAVTTPGGTGTGSRLYTYVKQPAPTVRSIRPKTGTTVGGTSVTITGTNFTGATVVTLGGTAATRVNVVSATTITAITPAHAAGVVSVAVTALGGTGTGSRLYTYVKPPASTVTAIAPTDGTRLDSTAVATRRAPTVTAIAPTSGTTLGGTSITITGIHLTGATAVTLGGVAASSVTVVNDTTITAATPAHAAGVVDVAVTTPGGTGIGSSLYTNVTPAAPTVTTVTITGTPSGPTAIARTGGTTVDSTAAAALMQLSQQGPKLVGTFAVEAPNQGKSVALSYDGNTAIIGGPGDNSGAGAAWVYTRNGDAWAQQGSKLLANDAVAGALGSQQGQSVALSADGNTALVGGPGDNSGVGAAWVYTRRGTVWTQQGSKLIGTGAVGNASQGQSVALSADGNTAIVGGPGDDSGLGVAWVYTRRGTVWTQQGSKLIGAGMVGNASHGQSVALSADGNTAIVGGPGDNSGVGATWVYTRSGTVWAQQGSKLVGTEMAGAALQGQSVALSADGNTAIVGGGGDKANTGAIWAYTRNGPTWTQQDSKLVGTGALGKARQGSSVAVSGDGSVALVGGNGDNSGTGAAWVFARISDIWTQQGSKLVGTGAAGKAAQGASVGLSTDGNTYILGGPYDSTMDGLGVGAAWIFVGPSLLITPVTNFATTGKQGGPYSPLSFQYTLTATTGSVNYSITNLPNWLTASSTSGTVTTTGTTIVFRINSSAADGLSPNSYAASIDFNNTTNKQGNTTRRVTLTVAPNKGGAGLSFH
jgi:hypothetical protein